MLAIGLAAATIALPAPTTAAGQGTKKSSKKGKKNTRCFKLEGFNPNRDPEDDYTDRAPNTVGQQCGTDDDRSDDCSPADGVVCTRDNVCVQGVDVTCAENPNYPHDGMVTDDWCSTNCFTFDLTPNSANANPVLNPGQSDFNDACFIQDQNDMTPNTDKQCRCLGTFPLSSSPSDAPSDAPSSSPSDALSCAPSMDPTAPPSDYPVGTKSILLRYCLPCDEVSSVQNPSCASQCGVFEKDTSVKGCGKYDTGTTYFAGPYVYPGFCSRWQYACSKTVAVLSKVVDSDFDGLDRASSDGPEGARDLFADTSIAGDCPGDFPAFYYGARSCRLWVELVFAPETPNKQVASIARQFRKDKRKHDLTITKANTKDGNCPETKLSAVQNLGAYDVVLVTVSDKSVACGWTEVEFKFHWGCRGQG